MSINTQSIVAPSKLKLKAAVSTETTSRRQAFFPFSQIGYLNSASRDNVRLLITERYELLVNLPIQYFRFVSFTLKELNRVTRSSESALSIKIKWLDDASADGGERAIRISNGL